MKTRIEQFHGANALLRYLLKKVNKLSIDNEGGGSTLQGVTTGPGSNVTSSALQIIKADNINNLINSTVLYNNGSSDEYIGGLGLTNGSSLVPFIESNPVTGNTYIYNNAQPGTGITLRAQTISNSGILTTLRISAANATQVSEVTNKGQVETMLYGDIATTSLTVFNLPIGGTTKYIEAAGADGDSFLPSWVSGEPRIVRLINMTTQYDNTVHTTGGSFILNEGALTSTLLVPFQSAVTFFWDDTNWVVI